MILVCSPSRFRQELYARILAVNGIDARFSMNALNCFNQVVDRLPFAIVVESQLMWGGIEGLLSVLREDERFVNIPVIVICLTTNAAQLFCLGGYRIASLLIGRPTEDSLLNAVAKITCEFVSNNRLRAVTKHQPA